MNISKEKLLLLDALTYYKEFSDGFFDEKLGRYRVFNTVGEFVDAATSVVGGSELPQKS